MRSPVLSILLCIFLSACSAPPAINSIRLVYVGTLESVSGVKDPLGCFCADGGYLNTCDGQRIPVCFTGGALPEDCDNIEVRGKYREGVADTPPDSPCPEGIFKYLLVEEWRCLK